MSDRQVFDSTLVKVPFAAGACEGIVADRYDRLLEGRDPEEVLVMTGSPTSSATVRERLSDHVPGAGLPRVTSPIVHATDILNRVDDRTIVSDVLRRELVHRFLENREWDTEYLQRASEQSSFVRDVARLMETTAWQDADFDATPELIDVGAAVDGFHEWLAEHDHLERGQLLAAALAALEDQERRADVVDADAILVVEFEELLPLDRRYLAALADGLELVCVAEESASVRRSWMEAGPIDEHVSFSRTESVTGEAPSTRPTATAAYLASGEMTDDPDSGSVSVLAADTHDEQLDLIVDEIERLRDLENRSYDEFAIVLKGSGLAVTETIRGLRRAGVPTESSTVVGFGDDPALREVLRFVRHMRTTETDDVPIAAEIGAALAVDGVTLGVDEATLAALEAMDGIVEPIRRWATESELKRRIAEGSPPLEARARFGNVRRAFRMAAFLEETEFLETSWASFEKMLERAHEHAPQRNQTSATHRKHGVRVDHVEALKNGAFRVVFLSNVVDEEYPGSPSLSRLFPDQRVCRMPDYPSVTNVDHADVEATFPTDSTASGDSFRRYHAEHARRRLAIGAAAATERLYFCLYTHEDTALEERVQPSRFLTDAYRRLPWIADAEVAEIASERGAEAYLLSRVDRALADVRRAQSQDVLVSIDEVEADLADIGQLLDESGERGEQLREALWARLDFANGVVRRE